MKSGICESNETNWKTNQIDHTQQQPQPNREKMDIIGARRKLELNVARYSLKHTCSSVHDLIE